MPTVRSFATRMPTSAKAKRQTRCFASSTSGHVRHHGSAPRHLVFDSKLTTYAGLDRLDEAEITFMTLRRRSPALLKEIVNLPASAWRTVTLDLSQRKYRTPRIYEQKVVSANAYSASSSSRISGTTNRRSW